MTKLYKNNVALVLPNRDRCGMKIDPAGVIDTISKEIGAIGLGLSISEQVGIWINDSGVAMREKIKIINVSFPDDLLLEVIGVIMRFVALSCYELNQEEVAVYINGTLIMVSIKLGGSNHEAGALVA